MLWSSCEIFHQALHAKPVHWVPAQPVQADAQWNCQFHRLVSNHLKFASTFNDPVCIYVFRKGMMGRWWTLRNSIVSTWGYLMSQLSCCRLSCFDDIHFWRLLRDFSCNFLDGDYPTQYYSVLPVPNASVYVIWQHYLKYIPEFVSRAHARRSILNFQKCFDMWNMNGLLQILLQ